MKQDIYQRVTGKIVADLEKGELTWLKPWSSGNLEGRITKPLRHNGETYSGINILMLWGAAMEGGYCSPYWMTFKQAKTFGANVRKGERGNLVVYANTFTKTEEGENGQEEERKRTGRRAKNPVHERLHRFQRGADRRLAQTLL